MWIVKRAAFRANTFFKSTRYYVQNAASKMTESGSVLLIGNGGREHAIAQTLSRSERVKKIFIAPGNAGTADENKCQNVSEVSASNFDSVVSFCRSSSIEMVFVGPEDPLCRGIANRLAEEGIPCFGPRKEAAEIEASKSWSKEFMKRHNIPTADFAIFSSPDEALDFVRTKCTWENVVVKASGLAAGKGVVVTSNKKEAEEAIGSIMKDHKFGAAGDTVVLEECLTGPEVSCLAFTDGQHVACFPPSQDHKRLWEGDLGPNTGGMGAYAPCDLLHGEALQYVKDQVMQRAVDGLRSEGRAFVGVLYAGLMLTADGPRVLEFNCRLGDPETQVLLPLLRSDLLSVAHACVSGSLKEGDVDFDVSRYRVCVVAVSKGYPESYPKGQVVTGLERASATVGCHVVHAGTKRDAAGEVVTNGGRVLAVVGSGPSVRTARRAALAGMAEVRFDALQFRRDIGHAVMQARPAVCGFTYKAAGVDIGAGDELVQRIGPVATSTARPGLRSRLGQFGAVFSASEAGYGPDSLLVSGTDGVGTKLCIAQAVGRLEGLGTDLVAMCANDVLCHAAEPLFFLDYYACSRLKPAEAEVVVRGIGEACREAGCALAGGETAEMPDLYARDDFDLAGFVVGAVSETQLLPRMAEIKAGDAVVGVASSGLHSNGFSLVRRIVRQLGLKLSDPCPFQPGVSLGEALLTPTKIYVRSLLPLLRSGKVKAAVHVTGGGIVENLPRVLPPGVGAEISATEWRWPPVFQWLQAAGVETKELVRTFNCGLGMLLIAENADDVCKEVKQEEAWVVGKVTEGEGVRVENVPHVKNTAMEKERVKVGVLISGSGTNLQALLDHSTKSASCCRVALVVSNVPSAFGLERARRAGVETAVVPHGVFPDRQSFETALTDVLKAHDIKLVCLAGFMRILTSHFVSEWSGRLINVHPSLLPAFKGAHAHRLALESGVRMTGATVHFVTENVDSGAIIAQGACEVRPEDTEETLAERVKTEVEHKIFPEAMETVASGRCRFDDVRNRTIWETN